jgi:quercetin dioxygenase-like cupin family protein
MEDTIRKEIEYYRQQIYDMSADIGISRGNTSDEKAEETIRVITNRWSEPAPGVKMNLCALTTVQSRVTVSNVVFEEGAEMGKHSHDRLERVYVVYGILKETVSGITINAGSSIQIPANKEHGWYSEEGCLVVATWEPPYHLYPGEEPKDITEKLR